MIGTKEPLTSTRTVKDVLDNYPQILRVFMDMRLLCIGCPMETIHTLEDIAIEYKLDLAQFLHRLQNAIENSIAEKE